MEVIMALDAIGIVSKDIQKSIQFYGALGLELKEAGSPDHYEATTESGVRIMVDTVELAKKINPNWKPSTGSSRMTLCFKQRSCSVVDDLYQECIEDGFTGIKEPWDAFWGQRYASILDPDGNQIDLFANL